MVARRPETLLVGRKLLAGLSRPWLLHGHAPRWLPALWLTLLPAVALAAVPPGAARPDSLATRSAATTAVSARGACRTHHGDLLRPALILAAGGVVSLWSHDEESPQAARDLLDHSDWDVFADAGNVYGDGAVLGSLSVGILALGKAGGNEALEALGGDLCETFLASAGTAWTLKVAVGRRRPAGGPHSFPSGHTATAFAVVPVVAHHLGWKAAVPAVVMACATGLGRMEEFRHFQSDVLFGAALGLACGEIVAGPGFLPGRATPVVTPAGVGVGLGF